MRCHLIIMLRYPRKLADFSVYLGRNATCPAPIGLLEQLTSFGRLIRPDVIFALEVVPPFLAAVRGCGTRLRWIG